MSRAPREDTIFEIGSDESGDEDEYILRGEEIEGGRGKDLIIKEEVLIFGGSINEILKIQSTRRRGIFLSKRVCVENDSFDAFF